MKLATQILSEVCQKHGINKRAKKIPVFAVIEMIEKALISNSFPNAIPYQICPVCSGSGNLPSNTASRSPCDTCGATKVIPMYVPPTHSVPMKCAFYTPKDKEGRCLGCNKLEHEHK